MAFLRSANVAKLQARGDLLGLGKLLQHKDPSVRASGASAIGEIHDARGVEPLLAAAGDGDPAVREAIQEALVRLGDARAAPTLLEVFWQLGDLSAAAALRDIGASELILDSLFERQRQMTRYASGQARTEDVLQMLGEPAVDALEIRLADPDGSVRIRSIGLLELLGKISSKTHSRVESALNRMLEDTSEFVRECAAGALETLTGTRPIVLTGLSSGRLAGGRALGAPSPQYDGHLRILIGTVRGWIAPGPGSLQMDSNKLPEIRGLADHRFLKPLIELVDLARSSKTTSRLNNFELDRLGKVLCELIDEVADKHWRDLATSLASEDPEVNEIALDALVALDHYYSTPRPSTPNWWSTDFVARKLDERNDRG